MHPKNTDVNMKPASSNNTKPEMLWSWLCQATGIAPLRGEAATRSEQATGGSQ